MLAKTLVFVSSKSARSWRFAIFPTSRGLSLQAPRASEFVLYSARVRKVAYIRGLPKHLTEAFYSEEGELRGTGKGALEGSTDKGGQGWTGLTV